MARLPHPAITEMQRAGLKTLADWLSRHFAIDVRPTHTYKRVISHTLPASLTTTNLTATVSGLRLGDVVNVNIVGKHPDVTLRGVWVSSADRLVAQWRNDTLSAVAISSTWLISTIRA